MMKQIVKEHMNYIFYEDGEEFVLSVVCGTIAYFDLNLRLNPEEKKAYLESGKSFLDSLAQKIRNDPFAFQDRKIDLKDPH